MCSHGQQQTALSLGDLLCHVSAHSPVYTALQVLIDT